MNRKDFKGNVWRELCARAIEANCGYSSGYHDRAALSWNVSCSGYIRNYWETLLARVIRDHGLTQEEMDEIDPAKVSAIKAEWEDDEHQNREWSNAIEDMQRSLLDGDSYRTIRPEIAARYGLTGSEAKLHSGIRYNFEHKYRDGAWAHVPYFTVGWTFMGRQGKHLCLTEFEGKDLNMQPDALADFIRTDDQGSYPNEWCQKLLAFIHECDIMFTSKNVSDEFEYQVSYRLEQDLREALDATQKEAKEAAERQAWAERDVMTKG